MATTKRRYAVLHKNSDWARTTFGVDTTFCNLGCADPEANVFMTTDQLFKAKAIREYLAKKFPGHTYTVVAISPIKD